MILSWEVQSTLPNTGRSILTELRNGKTKLGLPHGTAVLHALGVLSVLPPRPTRPAVPVAPGLQLGASDGGEAEFDVAGLEGVDDLVELAFHDRVEGVEGQVDAVVGQAVLREIVGADALGAVAGADLRLAFGGQLVVLLLALEGQQPGAEDAHGLVVVAVLRALVLAGDDQARRQVGQAHGGLGLVDLLAARAGRAEVVDAQLLGRDDDFAGLLDLGQHGDRRGGGVDAPLRLGLGNALDAVAARLVAQRLVDVGAFDGEDDFLEPAELGGRGVDDGGLEAARLAEVGIHPVEVAGEEGGLLAAGAGADFHDGVAGVVGIRRQHQGHHAALRPGKARLELLLLLEGDFAELGIGRRVGQQLGVLGQHLLDVPEVVRRRQQVAQALVVADQVLVGRRIRGGARRRHRGFEFGQAVLGLGEIGGVELHGGFSDVPSQYKTGRRRRNARNRPVAGWTLLGGLAGVALVEAVDAPFRIDELGLAREERMAGGAGVDAHRLHRRTGLEDMAAGAGDRGFFVLGMDVFFHAFIRPFWWKWRPDR